MERISQRMKGNDALVGASEPAALFMHLELFDVGTVDEHVDVLEHGAVRHLLVAAAVQSQMVFVLPNLSRTALTILRTSSRFSVLADRRRAG